MYVYVCIYVYIYMCIYVYIYVYMYTHECTIINIQRYVHICIHVCTHIYRCVHTYTYICCSNVCTYVYVYIYIYVRVHTYIYIYIYIMYTYTYMWTYWYTWFMLVCGSFSVNALTHVHLCMSVCGCWFGIHCKFARPHALCLSDCVYVLLCLCLFLCFGHKQQTYLLTAKSSRQSSLKSISGQQHTEWGQQQHDKPANLRASVWVRLLSAPTSKPHASTHVNHTLQSPFEHLTES